MRYEKELQNVLQKAVFPANKTKLIEIAQSLNSPHEVTKALENVRNHMRNTLADLISADEMLQTHRKNILTQIQSND